MFAFHSLYLCHTASNSWKCDANTKAKDQCTKNYTYPLGQQFSMWLTATFTSLHPFHSLHPLHLKLLQFDAKAHRGRSSRKKKVCWGLKHDTKAFLLHSVTHQPCCDDKYLSRFSHFVLAPEQKPLMSSVNPFSVFVWFKGLSSLDQHLAQHLAFSTYNIHVWNVRIQCVTQSDLPWILLKHWSWRWDMIIKKRYGTKEVFCVCEQFSKLA